MREQIRDWILDRIRKGSLQAGDRVTENAIAQQLHVSPIPVREAIRELAAMGVLDTEPHRGARVRRVELSETVEALEVRACLEPLALRLAGPALGGRSERLRGLAERMVAAAEVRDFRTFHRLNQHFHRGIAEASGSSVLLRVWDSLAYEVNARTVLDSLQSADPVAIAKEHGEVLEALEAGDASGAARLLGEHTENLARHMARQGLPSADGAKQIKKRRPRSATSRLPVPV